MEAKSRLCNNLFKSAVAFSKARRSSAPPWAAFGAVALRLDFLRVILAPICVQPSLHAKASVSKPAECICRSYRVQAALERAQQARLGLTAAAAHKGVQLGESLLNRRQIRRVSWQEQKCTVCPLDQVLYPLGLMSGQVIQQHDLPGPQRGHEHLLDKVLESRFIDCPVQAHRCLHPVQAHTG